MVIPNILWKIIQMFQTTNQYPYVEILLPTMETHIIIHQHLVDTPLIHKHPAGLEMGRVKTAFSCDWQEVNHAFRSVFSCFYVVHEGQFYCDFEFSLGFTVYS